MPALVGNVGANTAHLTLDIPERQVLIRMDDEAQDYWHHILVIRVAEARWVTCDPELHVAIDDLSGEEVIPLARAAAFPMEGRPYWAFSQLSEIELANIRTRGVALAEVHGVQLPLSGATTGPNAWYYADTSLGCFGQEVPQHLLLDPSVTKTGGAVGIVKVDLDDGRGAEWLLCERVLRSEQSKWLADKREGSGRDPRLSAMRAVTTANERPLFRTALASCGGAQVVDPQTFEGPAAYPEVVAAIARSGLEPPGFCQQYFTTSGLSAKSSLGIEFNYLVHTLWLMTCVDRLDGYRLVSSEHVARRILQIQSAVKKNARSPDFEGLSEYMKHAGEVSGRVSAPTFEKHIAERQRDAAQILKQNRLAKEEGEAEEKRRRAGRPGGKGEKADPG